MSKTEKLLMQRLAESGRVAIETHCGTGPEGGKVQWGLRQAIAARKLVAAGKAKAGNPETVYDCRNGYTVRVTLFTLYPA